MNYLKGHGRLPELGIPVFQSQHEEDRYEAGDDNGVAHEAFEGEVIGPKGFLHSDMYPVHVLIDRIADESISLDLLVVESIIDDINPVSSVVGAGIESECIGRCYVQMDAIQSISRAVIIDDVIELAVIEIDPRTVVPGADVPGECVVGGPAVHVDPVYRIILASVERDLVI